MLCPATCITLLGVEDEVGVISHLLVGGDANFVCGVEGKGLARSICAVDESVGFSTVVLRSHLLQVSSQSAKPTPLYVCPFMSANHGTLE